MNYLLLNFVIASWIEVITSLLVGVFLLIKGTQKSHKLFAMLALNVTWWSFCQILMVTGNNYQTALLWGRLGYAGATFIAPLFLHFTISFLQIKRKAYFLRIIYLASFVAVYLKFTKIGIEYVVPRYYVKYFITASFAFNLAIAILCVCTIYSFWKLLEAINNSSSERKNQLKYLFLSMLFGFTSGSANFLLAYGINIPFSPFLTYLGSMWPLIATYAILRHHLLDINIVIKKTAVYSILVTLITVSYFILIYITEFFFRGFVGYKSIYLTIGFLAIFTLLLQPIKNFIQSFIDKYFFKGSQAMLSERLQKAQEELKRAERLKAVGTLAAGMAHEIKNPLTGIKTFTEYLLAKHDEPGFLEKFHKIVSTEVDKINSTVQQLLDFSKPKPLQLKESNINKIIDQTVSLLSNSLIKHKIKLIRNYDDSITLLRVDANQMQQVFCNLFLNSIDAMKQGGELYISTKKDQGHAKITIRDTGKGIAKNDLEHIFDPFYTTKEDGTGLGMSITYGIIKEHKGTIEVESQENKSTSFIIKLPLNI